SRRVSTSGTRSHTSGGGSVKLICGGVSAGPTGCGGDTGCAEQASATSALRARASTLVVPFIVGSGGVGALRPVPLFDHLDHLARLLLTRDVEARLLAIRAARLFESHDGDLRIAILLGLSIQLAIQEHDGRP